MKFQKPLSFVVIMLCSTLMFGQATFTSFNGTEIGLGPPTGGTISCPNGQPTGVVFPSPCTPPESRVHIRGAKSPYIVQTNDTRFQGSEEVTTNGNFDSWRPDLFGPGSGQMWGTANIQVMAGDPPDWTPTGETWELVWTGTRTVSGNNVRSVIRVVAHGSGGRIEGLQAKYTVTLDPVANVGVVQGRILTPSRKVQ